jgi:integrase
MSIIPRRRRDGSIAYLVRVSVDGKRLPAETFDTRREARRRAGELVVKRQRVRTPETCDGFARRWPDDYPIVKTGPTRGKHKTPDTEARNRYALEPFIEEFRGVRLADLDRPTARAFALRHPRSADVARNLFQDAVDDGLVDTNPFSKLGTRRGSRAGHAPLRAEEIAQLGEIALKVHGPEYGPRFKALITFTAYVGPRLHEVCALEWPWVNFGQSEVEFRVAKFDKPRTVFLSEDAARALRAMPRSMEGSQVFRSKRGQPLTKTAHYALWNPVRAAFLASLTETRREELVEVVWHSLRHFTGHHFYVTLGFSDEEAAFQLGHSDAKLIRTLYGHGKADALERLKRGGLAEVRPIRTTSLPHAEGGAA